MKRRTFLSAAAIGSITLPTLPWLKKPLAGNLPQTLYVLYVPYGERIKVPPGHYISIWVVGTAILCGDVVIDTLTMNGGNTPQWASGRLLAMSPGNRTINSARVYPGSEIHDPKGTIFFTNGIDIVGSSRDIELNLGRGLSCLRATEVS